MDSEPKSVKMRCRGGVSRESETNHVVHDISREGRLPIENCSLSYLERNIDSLNTIIPHTASRNSRSRSAVVARLRTEDTRSENGIVLRTVATRQ